MAFDGDPGWAHERLILWKLFDPAVDGSLCSMYYVLTAGGDIYPEAVEDWLSVQGVRGDAFPDFAVGTQTVRFESAVGASAFASAVETAKADAVVLRSQAPGRLVPEDPRAARTWVGSLGPMPGTIWGAVNRRLRGKILPTVGPIGGGVPARVPVVAPVSVDFTRPGRSWVTIRPGGGTIVGTVMMLAVGSRVEANFGLALCDDGSYVPVEPVADYVLRGFLRGMVEDIGLEELDGASARTEPPETRWTCPPRDVITPGRRQAC